MHRNLIFILGLFIFVGALSAKASRDEFCKIKPNQLGSFAMKIHKQSKSEGKDSFPAASIIQSDVSIQFMSDIDTAVTATYEAFLRVEEDGNFAVLPIPIANVELNHERNIVYICTHVEPDSSGSFLEIYFLTGYDLGDTTWSSFAGDFLFSSIKVSPVSFSPVGFETVSNLLDRLGPFPFNLMAVPFDIASQAQGILMTAINKVLPAGIERIVMTNKEVVFSAKVDLDKPQSALFTYRVNLTKNTVPQKATKR